MYLFIFEDGEIAKSSVPPLPVDLDSIGEGLLQIVKIDDGDIKEFDADGSLVDVREALPDESNTYHSFA